MAIASRKNTVSEGEIPISSYKYNEEINNIYTILNSIATFFASETPSDDPSTGQYWLDTSVSPSVLRQYDGSVWRWTGFYYGITAPANPSPGAFFINQSSGTMSYWNGTAWTGLPATAISYDGTESCLTSTNVQAAIDEISVDYEAAAAAVSQALGYASAASASAYDAFLAADSAANSALNAADVVSNASWFAEKAEMWSDGEGEIEPGRFSAKFWADVASSGVTPDGSISNDKLANMDSKKIKGRNSEGYGVPEDLSMATVRSMIGNATSSTDGLMSAADKAKLDDIDNITVDEATTTTAGIVRLATNEETVTGTDGTIAVTPAGVTAVVGTLASSSAILTAIMIESY